MPLRGNPESDGSSFKSGDSYDSLLEDAQCPFVRSKDLKTHRKDANPGPVPPANPRPSKAMRPATHPRPSQVRSSAHRSFPPPGPKTLPRANTGPETLVPTNTGPETLVPTNTGPETFVPTNTGPETLPANTGPETLPPTTHQTPLKRKSTGLSLQSGSPQQSISPPSSIGTDATAAANRPRSKSPSYWQSFDCRYTTSVHM